MVDRLKGAFLSRVTLGKPYIDSLILLNTSSNSLLISLAIASYYLISLKLIDSFGMAYWSSSIFVSFLWITASYKSTISVSDYSDYT